MKIVIFTHPLFISHQSMPRYANMLFEGMVARGHEVAVWSPKAHFYNLPFGHSLKKWFSYIDQYVVFPIEVKLKLRNCDKETLFVFADQALGPWVPLVKNRKHVIHCHDFLALKSALGQIVENPTSFTGKLYQSYIKKSFSVGRCFISISRKTQKDLHYFLKRIPLFSEVVYNGLNQNFIQASKYLIRNKLTNDLNIKLSSGFILHVGGNQFYKNRTGVIEIYTAWRQLSEDNLPLLLIGSEPTIELAQLRRESPFAADIHFLAKVNDVVLKEAYQGASVLLFPSLAEGFGWPIAEAMASGSLVITTNEAPMTEVGGRAAYYIDRRPAKNIDSYQWANKSALVLKKILELNSIELQDCINSSLKNAERFNTENSLNQIETIYKEISKI